MSKRTGEVRIVLGYKLYAREDGWFEDDLGTKFNIEDGGNLAYQNNNGSWTVIRRPALQVAVQGSLDDQRYL